MFIHMFPYVIAAWLFFCGLYGIVTSPHLVHTVVCLAVLQTSTYVLLLTIGFRAGAAAPVFAGISPRHTDCRSAGAGTDVDRHCC